MVSFVQLYLKGSSAKKNSVAFWWRIPLKISDLKRHIGERGLGMTFIKLIYLKYTLLNFSGTESKFQTQLHNAYSQLEIIQGKG